MQVIRAHILECQRWYNIERTKTDKIDYKKALEGKPSSALLMVAEAGFEQGSSVRLDRRTAQPTRNLHYLLC